MNSSPKKNALSSQVKKDNIELLNNASHDKKKRSFTFICYSVFKFFIIIALAIVFTLPVLYELGE
jgi:hypothetical protein